MKIFLFALLISFCIHGASLAADLGTSSITLDQQEKIENYKKLENAVDEAGILLNKISTEKNGQCMKAIGNTDFCKCITEKSPSGVDFIQYVAIVAGTKNDFKYDELSQQDKDLFNATRQSRDKCVSRTGK
jgi:hypothetical protein